MKKIMTFVQKNQMAVAVAMIMIAFSTWMYSAYTNMLERDAQREARIKQVIANGGTHYPSEQLTVNHNYIAECND